jgi:hypothetical protein
MKINFLIPVILILAIKSQAQMQIANVRDEAMGNATVACIHTSGIPKNISLLPESENNYIVLSCTNKYFIKELSPVFLNVSKKLKNNFSVVVGVGRVGGESFAEQFFEGGVAKMLGPKFSVGLKFQYYQWVLNESHYNSSSAFIPEIDLYASPLKNLNFGVVIRNPVRSRMNTIENKLPAEINPGASYKISNKVLIAFSVKEKSDEPLSCQAGVEYEFHQKFSLRIGWHTLPVSESLGFCLKLSKFNIDYSIQSHPQLGYSSSLGLSLAL